MEAVCERVIIIASGRIALDQPLDQLHDARAVEVEVRGPVDAVRKALETTPGAGSVRKVGGEGDLGRFEVRAKDRSATEELREQIAKRVIQNNWALRRLDLSRSTLEERFVEAVRGLVAEQGAGAA